MCKYQPAQGGARTPIQFFLYDQVNAVAWNELGTHLLSGSDDCHLNIYDSVNRTVKSFVMAYLRHVNSPLL